jgi:hypothetical protein
VVRGAVDAESSTRKAPKKRLRLSMAARTISDHPTATEALADGASAVTAPSVRLATAAARHTWNKVLVRRSSAPGECPIAPGGRCGAPPAGVANAGRHWECSGHAAQVSVANTNIPPPPLAGRWS